MESKYRELVNNKPKLNIKKNAREVIFKTVASMCDNVHYISFKKNSEGDFIMSGGISSLSNWQFKHTVSEIEWVADDENWEEVVDMINSGTAVVESVRSR
jgi:hypothetical protein